MQNRPDRSWLYYKLIAGGYNWAFNRLILNVGEIAKDARAKQWFFIRYIDEDGPHIRLRFCVEAAQSNAFDREVYPKLHDLIVQLSNHPLEEEPRLVKIPTQDFGNTRVPVPYFGVKRNQYTPETDIYGGRNGVAIAERLFQISSEIAIEVISQDRNGISYKDIVPALMMAALEEFKIAKSPSEFLANYIDHWTTAAASWGSYIITFEKKCSELVESEIPVVLPDDQYNPVHTAMLRKWRRALCDAQAAYKKLPDYSDPLVERLLFYFLHLMNNRIGITVLEEIYLAVLLRNYKGGERLNLHEFTK